VTRGSSTQLAWVESPLQLLSVAEYAAAHDRDVAVAFRLSSPHMTSTAHELLARGARFTMRAPYFGVPWSLLASSREWIVGDGFSGQFRAAMSTLGARSVTLVDDGWMTVHLARALGGATAYSRPGRLETPVRRVLGGLARDRLMRLAARERLTLFTSFATNPAVAALSLRGVKVEPNAFAWTCAHARPIDLPHTRVVLGSAAVTDGTMSQERYLSWLIALARAAPFSYLPHRRESAEQLDWISLLPRVELVRTGLPVELALAGSSQPLELVTLPSTAAMTLEHVLEGTGSSIRTAPTPERVS
jgi:hypothetical protein